MEVFEETVTALGPPLWVRNIGSGARPTALISRWKHGDARLEINAGDAMRVCLSLCGGHTIRSCSRLAPAQPIVGGNMGLMAPDRPSAVKIDGEADVFQIFVDRSVLDDAADHRFDCESALGINDRDLLAATVRLFVSARHDGPDEDLLRQTNLWLLVEQLLARQSSGEGTVPRGRISSTAMRRIDELIIDRLCGADSRAPSVDELAAAARMSVSHFIRAFRQSTGLTPHQHVLSRRMERAMVLLARRDVSVAEVADQTGYASPAHFIASFKQRLGITPGAYRGSVFE
jgi:AraC family transcriptional regulator